MFQMLALPLRSVASPALPNSAPPQVLSQCQPWYNHGTIMVQQRNHGQTISTMVQKQLRAKTPTGFSQFQQWYRIRKAKLGDLRPSSLVNRHFSFVATPQVVKEFQPWYNHGTAKEPWYRSSSEQNPPQVSHNSKHGTEAEAVLSQ